MHIFSPRTTTDRLIVAAAIAAAVLGALVVLFGTQIAPWVEDDSVEYIEAARNLASGRGLTLTRASGNVVPLHLRPPIFPLLLAGFQTAGIDMLQGIRLVNSLALAGVILVTALSVGIGLGRPGFSLAVTLLLVTSKDFIEPFLGVMSESLFLLLSAVAIVSLVVHAKTSELRWLAISILASAGLILTRYAGIVVIGFGCLLLLAILDQEPRARAKTSIIYAGLSGLPFGLWFFGNRAAGGSLGQYSFPNDIWTAMTPARLGIADILWNWIPAAQYLGSIPYRIRVACIAAIFLLALGVALWPSIRCHMSSRERESCRPAPIAMLVILSAAFTLLYLIFLISSFLFTKYPVINERVMLPLLVAGWLVSLGALTILLEWIWDRRGALSGVVLVGLLAAGLQAPPTWRMIRNLHENGRGYSSLGWRSSEVVDALGSIPSSTPLISTDIAALEYYLSRHAYRIPELAGGPKAEILTPFGEDRRDPIERIYRRQGAALVVFEEAYWQFDAQYYEMTETRRESFAAASCVFFQGRDGAIYFYDPSGNRGHGKNNLTPQPCSE